MEITWEYEKQALGGVQKVFLCKKTRTKSKCQGMHTRPLLLKLQPHCSAGSFQITFSNLYLQPRLFHKLQALCACMAMCWIAQAQRVPEVDFAAPLPAPCTPMPPCTALSSPADSNLVVLRPSRTPCCFSLTLEIYWAPPSNIQA